MVIDKFNSTKENGVVWLYTIFHVRRTECSKHQGSLWAT
jgi:hypothetical protein